MSRMRIVVDANVFISALLRDSMTRRILLYPGFDFITPSYLVGEIEEHEPELMMRSKASKQEFDEAIELLLGGISIIDKDLYSEKMDTAHKVLGKVDPDDEEYLALALALQADAIWSDDAHFKKQQQVLVLTTKDMVKLFSSKKED